MGNIIKTGVNILESGADLIKGRKSSSALKPFSIDDLTLVTKADDTKTKRQIDLDNIMVSENKGKAVADFKKKYNVVEAFNADDMRYVGKEHYNLTSDQLKNTNTMRSAMSKKI